MVTRVRTTREDRLALRAKARSSIPCKFEFTKGGCRFGAACEFVHVNVGDSKAKTKPANGANDARDWSANAGTRAEEAIEVPNDGFVAFLIGKGGDRIGQLTVETGCTFDVEAANGAARGASTRRILIEGTCAQRATAKQAVQDRLEQFQEREQRLAASTKERRQTAHGARTPKEAVVAARATERAGADAGDDALCVVCLDGAKTHCLLPCGHRCVCAHCAPDFGEGSDKGWKRVGGSAPACPICRTPVSMVVRVWD